MSSPFSSLVPAYVALVVLPTAALVSCANGGDGGGTESQPLSEVGGNDPDAEPGRGDAGANAEASVTSSGDSGSDGGSAQQPVVGGCRIGRAATSAACDEPCDARLALPGGGTFCTVQCGAPSDCNAPASGLACPTDVGACMPRCTSDATCKASGFARCVVAAGACDTI